jgi:hypothetical protein
MDDNNYRVNTAELQEQQEIRVNNSIAIMEQKCNVGSVQFLKSNFENKKIRERITEPDIKTLIGTILIKIGALAGFKNEIDFLIGQDIIKMIFSTYGDLTVEEIHKAFELERYGSFEDKTEHFQLFNADYIAKILKKYKNWKQNIKIHHDITSNSTLKLEEITASQKEDIIKNGVNRLYEQYKTSKIIEDPSEYLFDFLVEKGIIKSNSNPKLIEYYQMQLQKATAELKSETIVKTSTSKTERSQIKIDLEEIISGSSPKIIIRAKKNILTEFFNKQILSQTEKIF